LIGHIIRNGEFSVNILEGAISGKKGRRKTSTTILKVTRQKHRSWYLYNNEKNGLLQFRMESCQPIKRLKDKKKNHLADTWSIAWLYASVCKNLQIFSNCLRCPEHVVDYLRTIRDFSQNTLYFVRFILCNAIKKSPHLIEISVQKSDEMSRLVFFSLTTKIPVYYLE